MPYKVFNPGDEALASDVNTMLLGQSVIRFSSAAARTAAIAAPTLNQLTMLDTAPGAVDYWNGSAWARAGSGAEIQYQQVTAPISITATSAPAANLVVGSAAMTFDGSPVMLEFYAGVAQAPNVASGQMAINLFDGSTDLGYIAMLLGQQATTTVHVRTRLTPTVGSHTYSVKAWLPTGTGGNIQAGAGGTAATYQPCFLRVTRA